MDNESNPNPQDLVVELGELSPKPTVESTPEPTPTPEPADEDYYLKIDKRNLNQEINRLLKEEKEFANLFNTNVGRKAKSQYQSQLESLELERNNLRQELRRHEINAMKDAEIEEKFRTDPIFAKEYASIVHADPKQVEAQLELINIRRAIEDTFNNALDLGLTSEKHQEFLKAVFEGRYDNPNGHWTQGITRLQTDLVGILLSDRTPTSPKETKDTPVEPQVNPALTKAGPDISTTGIVKSNRGNVDVEDYQRALREGKNVPSEEIDKITAKYANR